MTDATPQPRVLVVEDSPDLLALMTRTLEGAGYHVRGVPDGAAALEHMAAEPTDLLVLDLMLPVMNGLKVLAAIREHPRLSTLPVIVTTGTIVGAFELRHLSVSAMLHKPFDQRALLDAVRAVLATRKFDDSKGTSGTEG